MEPPFFSARATSAPRGGRHPGFLTCRRSEYRQPGIFFGQPQYIQTSEKSRTKSRLCAAIAYSRRGGADFCVDRLARYHSRTPASRRPAVRVRAWAAARAFARTATAGIFFPDPRRRPEKRRNTCGRYALQRDARSATRSAYQKSKKSRGTAPDLGMVPRGLSRHEF